MATNYDIDYNDKRFTAVESDKKEALNEVDVTYGNMINSADSYYQKQIDAAQDYADKQSALQQQQTDFAIDKIEQQKEQTKKDYIKEQSGAYVDWQKQSNPYGVDAEQKAAAGLANSGYSESSIVSMYNTYQNRVATARDVVNRAILDYDNQMTEARLQNSSILAEIAYNALQKRLELSLAGFQYKNTLLLEQANKKLEVEQMYHDRYQDVLAQINTENALAEEVRQYNEKLALEQEQLKLQQDQFAWQKSQASKSSSGSLSIKKSSGGSSSNKSSSSKKSSTANSKVDKRAIAAKGGTSKNQNVQLPIDMQSVLALGYGPISASRLAELESQGIIESYKSGNQMKFRKSASTFKQESLLK